MYKTSHYNVYVPVEEKDTLLIFNMITGGLFRLNNATGAKLLEWSTQPKLPRDAYESHRDLIKDLYVSGILVDGHIDEVEQAHQFYLRRKKRAYYSSNLGITIVPNLGCNMSCKYCYLSNKPFKEMSDETIDSMVGLIEREVKKRKEMVIDDEDLAGISPDPKSLFVTWIGGEPTLGPSVVEKVSRKLGYFAESRDINFSSQMISNGVLLDEKWHALLKLARIEAIQVTIDGGRETHNVSRPVKGPTEKNYDAILDNLSKIPGDIAVTIRINCDKKVATNVAPLLEDLEKRSIWPQKAHQFKLSANVIRNFNLLDSAITDADDTSTYYKHWGQFYQAKKEFTRLQLIHYNRWAEATGQKKRKLRWNTADAIFDDCSLTSSPRNLVFGPDGYLYKCYEVPHLPNYRIQHVSEELDHQNKDHRQWLDYDRFTTFKKCTNCKYVLRCNVAYCTMNKFREKPPICCEEKFTFEDSLRDQYIQSLDNPGEMETLEELANRI